MVNHEKITFRTAIKPGLVRITLKRGAPLAVLGASIIIIGGTLLPLAALKIWGIPLFFLALILISIGWLPYRKLQRLELKPNTLEYDGEFLVYFQNGKGLFKIPILSIEKVDSLENESHYGLRIWLKEPIPDKIRVLQRGFNYESYMNRSGNRFGCDLFLPYFTQRNVEEIKVLLESDHAS